MTRYEAKRRLARDLGLPLMTENFTPAQIEMGYREGGLTAFAAQMLCLKALGVARSTAEKDMDKLIEASRPDGSFGNGPKVMTQDQVKRAWIQKCHTPYDKNAYSSEMDNEFIRTR